MDKRWADVRKAVVFSGVTGLLFGVAFCLFMLFSSSPDSPKGPLLLVIPLMTGLVSGAAGATGVYLDRFLERRGVKGPGVRRAITFLIVVVIAYGVAIMAVRGTPAAMRGNPAWAMLAGLGFGGTVALVEYRLWQMRQQMLRLELENKYLSEIAKKDTLLAEATEDLVLAEERNRVAGDLHDSVSSGIHGIVYAIHSLKQAISAGESATGGEAGPKDRVPQILDLLEKTAQSTQDELRAMILELKPSLLDEKGLAEALRLHCELFSQRQGIPVDLKVEDAPGLSPEQQVAAYRVAQEALTNILKHSGATQASVWLSQREGSVALTVADNGKGFAADSLGSPGTPGGLGLKNMESRCARNDGTFEVSSSPGAGTTIRAIFRT